jgi:hypothetical protein
MNWKVVAGFAVVGALISLIAGIAGGNPFGIILLRLVLSAVVFAALGIGVMIALRRFMPELLSRPGDLTESEARAARPGLDIVIDEDIPLEGESLLEDRELAASGALGVAGAGEASGLGGEEVASAVESPELPEALEAAEEVTDLGGPTTAEAEEELSPLEGDEHTAAPGGRRPASSTWQPLGEEMGSLDALPELEQPSATAEARPPSRGAREASRARVEQTVAGQDPANLAKAVRTFLRKDQEG